MSNNKFNTEEDKGTEIIGIPFIVWVKKSGITFKHFAKINKGGDKWEWLKLYKDGECIHVEMKDTATGFIIKRKSWKRIEVNINDNKSVRNEFKRPKEYYRLSGKKLW